MSLLSEIYGPFGAIAAGLFGLVVGSFVNVLIHRLPRGESVVFPSSHCPACGAPIRPADNIPLLSWVLLRGRCRVCKAPISARYPLIELSNGLLWTLIFLTSRDLADFFSGAFFVSSCLALAAIDARFQILPDRITLSGIAAGIVFSFFSSTRAPVSALAGAALGAGGLYLVAFVYRKATGQEGMGLGDVKMLGMIGAFLGPSGMVVTVLLASLSGSVVGLFLIAVGSGDRKMRLPFGVFLAAGAVASFFFAPALLERYRALWPAA